MPKNSGKNRKRIKQTTVEVEALLTLFPTGERELLVTLGRDSDPSSVSEFTVEGKSALECHGKALESLARLLKGHRIVKHREHVGILYPTVERWEFEIPTLEAVQVYPTPIHTRYEEVVTNAVPGDSPPMRLELERTDLQLRLLMARAAWKAEDGETLPDVLRSAEYQEGLEPHAPGIMLLQEHWTSWVRNRVSVGERRRRGAEDFRSRFLAFSKRMVASGVVHPPLLPGPQSADLPADFYESHFC